MVTFCVALNEWAATYATGTVKCNATSPYLKFCRHGIRMSKIYVRTTTRSNIATIATALTEFRCAEKQQYQHRAIPLWKMTYKFLLEQERKKAQQYCLVGRDKSSSLRWLSLSGYVIWPCQYFGASTSIYSMVKIDVCVSIWTAARSISTIQIFGELFYASHVI